MSTHHFVFLQSMDFHFMTKITLKFIFTKNNITMIRLLKNLISGGLAKESISNAKKSDMDFEDIENTIFFRDYTAQTLRNFSRHTWQKFKNRGSHQILMPQLFLSGDAHSEFVRGFGRFYFESRKAKNTEQDNLYPVAQLSEHKFWCDRTNWPRESPGEIFFAYQCQSCQSKWVPRDDSSDTSGYLKVGFKIHIRIALSTSHALGFLKNALKIRKSTPIKANRLCLKSARFSRSFNNHLAATEYDVTKSMQELEAILPLNERDFTIVDFTVEKHQSFEPLAEDSNLAKYFYYLGVIAENFNTASAIKDISSFNSAAKVIPDVQINPNLDEATIKADISIDDDIFGDLSGESGDFINETLSNSYLESQQKVADIAKSSNTSSKFNFNDPCDFYQSLRRTCLKNFYDSDYFLKPGDLFQPSLGMLKCSRESLYTKDENCKNMQHFFDTLDFELQKMRAEHKAYINKIARRTTPSHSDLNERDLEKINLRLAKIDSLEEKLKNKRKEVLTKISQVRSSLLGQEFSQLSHLPSSMARFENFYRTLRISHASPNPISSGIIKESTFPDESELKSEFSLIYSRFFRSAFTSTVKGVDDHVAKAVKLLDNFKRFYSETNVIMANSGFSPEEKVFKIMQIIHTFHGPKDFDDMHEFEEFSFLKFQKPKAAPIEDDLNCSTASDMPKLTVLFPERPAGTSTPKKSQPENTFMGRSLAKNDDERFLIELFF